VTDGKKKRFGKMAGQAGEEGPTGGYFTTSGNVMCLGKKGKSGFFSRIKSQQALPDHESHLWEGRTALGERKRKALNATT